MDYEVNAYSSDEEPRRPKIIRHRPNFFEEYDQKDFFDRFRLSTRTVENILEEIEDLIAYPTNRNDCLSSSQQLLLTLNFYANGSFLRTSGDFCGVSKSTSSKTVRRVSLALASLRNNYIKMPQTPEEINRVRQSFYYKARFPRCIGAIDCTHVKIQSPGGENGEIFRNRKQYFSLNVQTIVNTDLEIQNIVARWPGSSHDSHIFRNSAIYRSFELGHYGDSLIVGDSGYPIKKYLLTPLLAPRNEPESLFNESQIRTRNCVERSYGVWKRRFPSLAMGLRVNLDTAQAIVVATGVLHNIACNANEQVPPVDAEQEAAINFVNNMEVPAVAEHREGANNRTRFNLINNYFARL